MSWWTPTYLSPRSCHGCVCFIKYTAIYSSVSPSSLFDAFQSTLWISILTPITSLLTQLFLRKHRVRILCSLTLENSCHKEFLMTSDYVRIDSNFRKVLFILFHCCSFLSLSFNFYSRESSPK